MGYKGKLHPGLKDILIRSVVELTEHKSSAIATTIDIVESTKELRDKMTQDLYYLKTLCHDRCQHAIRMIDTCDSMYTAMHSAFRIVYPNISSVDSPKDYYKNFDLFHQMILTRLEEHWTIKMNKLESLQDYVDE